MPTTAPEPAGYSGSLSRSTLVYLPADILEQIFQLLRSAWVTDIYASTPLRFDYELFQGEYLLPLSTSCRIMRAQTLPYIFRELYNWDSSRGTVWPQSLWPYCKIVHIRDRTVRTAMKLDISEQTIHALSAMPFLVKVTLRFESSIPSRILHALSLSPSLLHLEIYQARVDGEPLPFSLTFPALETLIISTAGFLSVVDQDEVDRDKQSSNIHSLLAVLGSRLREIRISGDLISPAFPTIEWKHLQKLVITEHTPTPYVAVPDIVANMPALRDLQVLYTAPVSHNFPDLPTSRISPVLHLGSTTCSTLSDTCPLLSSVTLGNLLPGDSIFAQLPATLSSLRLRAPVDPYNDNMGFPEYAHYPLNQDTLPRALDHMRHLHDLREFCIDLDFFVTASLIQAIGSTLPQIEVLEFNIPRYQFIASPHRFNKNDRDPAILLALNLFSNLRHLRTTMNFMRFFDDPHYSREVTAQ
ncbi:hypothetical protein R3P38DRAFT_3102448 [Favolaschia claudopus]|uniref:F-box domain-containing protein n=1 Tax=Favolaschia claudopus TaxID=2862362 RepID=A0AAV9ZL68_9AGAR